MVDNRINYRQISKWRYADVEAWNEAWDKISRANQGETFGLLYWVLCLEFISHNEDKQKVLPCAESGKLILLSGLSYFQVNQGCPALPMFSLSKSQFFFWILLETNFFLWSFLISRGSTDFLSADWLLMNLLMFADVPILCSLGWFLDHCGGDLLGSPVARISCLIIHRCVF